MFHLPDLPNVGYATDRERRLSDNIMDFMRQTERDRLRLLTIVLEGREKWKAVAGDIWRGYRIGQEDGVLMAIYDYFVLQAIRPGSIAQREYLAFIKNPEKKREIERRVWPDLEQQRELLRHLPQ
mgnify:CR=1 FL=1